ncbi:MAG: hypothetical protein RI894_1483 [Bacteroidota bacterium]|jgi:uncharacterized RDD family membrane protein YckC
MVRDAIMPPDVSSTSGIVTSLAIGILTMFAYYVIMETMTGQTVGKMLLKTQVVGEDGQQPSAGTIALRTLCRMIPFEAFSFLGAEGGGWHDTLSHTQVVKK